MPPSSIPRDTGHAGPRLSLPAISRRRVVTRGPAAAALALGALAGLRPLPRAARGQTPPRPALPLTGLLVTTSATGAAIDPAALSGGLVVRLTLENQTGADLSGVIVRVPLPPRARVMGSTPAGAVEGGAMSWAGLTLRAGMRDDTFSFRLVPEPGADGAVIFREAALRPAVAGTGPSGVGVAAEPFSLRLNGLWGEDGLRRTLLPSGLTMFTRERPDTATVALRVAVRAGSRDEDDTNSGGAHWLEHAHFLGTTKRPSQRAIFDAISGVGGQTNAGTSWDWTDYWNLVPADQFDLALDVLSDMLLNSTFDPVAFERERLVVVEELKRRADTPSNISTVEFANLVFQVSPLGRYRGGTVESVGAISIETMLSFRERHYVTGSMAVAASGNLRHDEAVEKFARAFAGLARGPRLDRPPIAEPVQSAPRRREIGAGMRVAEIRLGWPVAGDDGDDSPAIVILQDILGTTGRRLQEEIRDRRASLRAISGRRALGNESNDSQTSRAVSEVTGTLDSAEEFQARLRRVRAADIQRVARTYLDLVNYSLVIARQ